MLRVVPSTDSEEHADTGGGATRFLKPEMNPQERTTPAAFFYAGTKGLELTVFRSKNRCLARAAASGEESSSDTTPKSTEPSADVAMNAKIACVSLRS